jgi:hypothetical protein
MEVPMTNETHIADIESNGADVREHGVPRRNMLKVLGTAAAGAAVGSVALSQTASADEHTPLEFIAITPTRVYDSRLDMGDTEDGRISTGDRRLVPVRDGRHAFTGAITTTNLVPAGARAISYNVTVVDTQAAIDGYLYVAPSTANEVFASTINWPRDLLGSLANGTQVLLGDDRELRVFCGGSGASTHFIIDINGYYM